MSEAATPNTDTIETVVTLVNIRGLHARASAKFYTCAESFNAEVSVTKGCETVIADSIMELLMLGAAYQDDIKISAKGPEAQAAISALVGLVEGHFGEDK